MKIRPGFFLSSVSQGWQEQSINALENITIFNNIALNTIKTMRTLALHECRFRAIVPCLWESFNSKNYILRNEYKKTLFLKTVFGFYKKKTCTVLLMRSNVCFYKEV